MEQQENNNPAPVALHQTSERDQQSNKGIKERIKDAVSVFKNAVSTGIAKKAVQHIGNETGRVVQQAAVEVNNQYHNYDDKAKKDQCFYCLAVFSLIFHVFMSVIYIGVWIYLVTGKELKTVCINEGFDSDYFCIIGVGQFSSGILVFAQFGFGLVGVTQIGVMLVAGVGQIIGSVLLVPFGQIVSAGYVWASQACIAGWKLGMSLTGLQGLDSLINKTKAYDLCCRKYHANKERVIRNDA